jgi:sterol desaturase/sphingolipid hydroxylase (fatty acid hydroxylase superfamily)
MWLPAGGFVLWFGGLAWLESRRPLRRSVESKRARMARNAFLGVIGAATIRLVELPVTLPLAARVEENGWGLLSLIPAPPLVQVVLALVSLDYTLYLWHVLTHRVAWLWRFHVVHHADLDLDASTALRFHAGELALSVPWRVCQILLIGVSPFALALWQGLLLLSTLFHHSNLELPLAVERWLVRLIVTPRMHGIHHSTRDEEINSNWSNGLTLWDRLHGTLRLNVRQREITIGVASYRSPAEVDLGRMLRLPFTHRPPSSSTVEPRVSPTAELLP